MILPHVSQVSSVHANRYMEVKNNEAGINLHTSAPHVPENGSRLRRDVAAEPKVVLKKWQAWTLTGGRCVATDLKLLTSVSLASGQHQHTASRKF